MMEKVQAQDGNRVVVHYTGRFTDGQVFDSSVSRNEPIEFTIGEGQMIPGFENAVRGMAVNETVIVTLNPDEAYGPVNEDLIVRYNLSELPEDLSPNVGDQLMLTLQDGSKFPVVVSNITDAEIELDGNHPMAGRMLVFEIELLEVH